jgi:GAF domain-containing protein
LRANLTETPLDDPDSNLGADGLAFPVALRGLLIGMLVVASRPSELYSPKERELLLHLTHRVGASLHAMYVNQAQTFLTEVANGVLPSSEKTRALAIQLIQAHPAVRRGDWLRNRNGESKSNGLVFAYYREHGIRWDQVR